MPIEYDNVTAGMIKSVFYMFWRYRFRLDSTRWCNHLVEIIMFWVVLFYPCLPKPISPFNFHEKEWSVYLLKDLFQGGWGRDLYNAEAVFACLLDRFDCINQYIDFLFTAHMWFSWGVSLYWLQHAVQAWPYFSFTQELLSTCSLTTRHWFTNTATLHSILNILPPVGSLFFHFTSDMQDTSTCIQEVYNFHLLLHVEHLPCCIVLFHYFDCSLHSQKNIVVQKYLSEIKTWSFFF